MRKGYEGLSELVRSALRKDVLSGDLFLFVGKDRRRAKVLYFDGTGLCLLSKRLDKGRFAALWRRRPDGERFELTATELALFLEGSELVGRFPLSPPRISDADLAPRSRL
jgi:transposase